MRNKDHTKRVKNWEKEWDSKWTRGKEDLMSTMQKNFIHSILKKQEEEIVKALPHEKSLEESDFDTGWNACIDEFTAKIKKI